MHASHQTASRPDVLNKSHKKTLRASFLTYWSYIQNLAIADDDAKMQCEGTIMSKHCTDAGASCNASPSIELGFCL